MIVQRPRRRPVPGTRAGEPRGEVVVTLRGDLDLATVESLTHLLSTSQTLERTDLVVDLGDVTFLDGHSAGLIIRAGAVLRERSCSLTVRGVAPNGRRVLELCGASDAPNGIMAPRAPSRPPASLA